MLRPVIVCEGYKTFEHDTSHLCAEKLKKAFWEMKPFQECNKNDKLFSDDETVGRDKWETF